MFFGIMGIVLVNFDVLVIVRNCYLSIFGIIILLNNILFGFKFWYFFIDR